MRARVEFLQVHAEQSFNCLEGQEQKRPTSAAATVLIVKAIGVS